MILEVPVIVRNWDVFMHVSIDSIIYSKFILSLKDIQNQSYLLRLATNDDS